MTAGLYRKQQTYRKNQTYGKSVSYGKMQSYGKPPYGLGPGVYPTDSQGNLTYKLTGSQEYSYSTFDTNFTLNYIEVFDDGSQSEVQSRALTLVAGENSPETIVSTESPGAFPVGRDINVILWRYDTFTNDSTDLMFSFNLEDIAAPQYYTYTITGNALPIPSNIDGVSIGRSYVGSFTPPEGDYEVDFIHTDPNGVVTNTSNGAVISRWAPHVFWRTIDGNSNMRDDLPPVSKSSVSATYVKGYNTLTNPDGTPIYDPDGAINTNDDLRDIGEDIVESFSLVEGSNNIVKSGVTDNFGNTKSTDTKTLIATIPEGPDFSDIENGIVGQLGQNQLGGTFDDILDGVVAQLGETV